MATMILFIDVTSLSQSNYMNRAGMALEKIRMNSSNPRFSED